MVVPGPLPTDAPTGTATGAATAARRGPVLRWFVLLLLAAGLLWLGARFLGAEKDAAPLRKPTRITVLRPPPPPPPPPKQEKPPEPPKIKEEIKIDPPKPVDAPPKAQPQEAPPPGPLGVDAQGTGPGDGFGLAGRPGGRDIVLGGGGGGNALSNASFANSAARHIAQELARDARLRASEYRIVINVWVGRDGRVERHAIVTGSGNSETDRLIADGLAQVAPLRQPPEGLPQPMRIRVTSSDA